MEPSYVSIIILVAALGAYISDMIPIPAIAIASAAAMVLFKVAPASVVWATFGQDAILLMGGMTLIGSTLSMSGAIHKLSDLIRRLSKGNANLSIFWILLIATFISPFVNSTTVLLMFVPLVLGVVVSANDPNITEQKYIQALVLMVCVGSLGTLVGTGTTIAASGLMSRAGYGEIGFFAFTPVAVVSFFLSLIYIFTVGSKIADRMVLKKPYRSDLVLEFVANYENNKKSINEDKPMTRQAVMSVIIMVCTIIGLITNKYHQLGLGTVAVIGGLMCILTKCITFKEAVTRISWESILILGGTLGCASALDVSGGGEVIAKAALSLFGKTLTPYILYIAMTLISGVLGQVLSNTATVGILIPIAVPLCEQLGVSPVQVIYGITIVSTLTLMTPMSSHLQAMTVNWGSYKFIDYIKYSGPINILLIILVILLIPLFYPFTAP